MRGIVGKKVNMFANSYHKNRSIWEFSLRKLGVKWIQHELEGRLLIQSANCLQRIFYSSGLEYFKKPFFYLQKRLIGI